MTSVVETRGRKPKSGVRIDIEVIRRIGERIAMGVPDKYACLLERVEYESFRMARERHPEWDVIIDSERAVFIHDALTVMRGCEKGHRGLEFILERRHKDLFNRVETQVTNNVTNNTLMIPDSTLEEIRAIAQARFTVPVKAIEGVKS